MGKRTYNRTPVDVSLGYYEKLALQDSYFNINEFNGLNTTKNYLTVDPATFADSNNVYVNQDNELSVRPPVQKYNLSYILPTDIVLGSFLLNDVCVYHIFRNEKYYLLPVISNVPNDVVEVYDKVLAGYYGKYCLFFTQNSKDLLTANMLLIATVNYTNFTFDWQSLSNAIYTPVNEEAVNLLGGGTKTSITFTHDTIPSVTNLIGKTVNVIIDDETYENVTFTEYTTLSFASKVGDVGKSTYDDKVSCSNDGRILLSTQSTLWLSIDGRVWMDIGWQNITPDLTGRHACISNDGGLIVISSVITSMVALGYISLSGTKVDISWSNVVAKDSNLSSAYCAFNKDWSNKTNGRNITTLGIQQLLGLNDVLGAYATYEHVVNTTYSYDCQDSDGNATVSYKGQVLDVYAVDSNNFAILSYGSYTLTYYGSSSSYHMEAVDYGTYSTPIVTIFKYENSTWKILGLGITRIGEGLHLGTSSNVASMYTSLINAAKGSAKDSIPDNILLNDSYRIKYNIGSGYNTSVIAVSALYRSPLYGSSLDGYKLSTSIVLFSHDNFAGSVHSRCYKPEYLTTVSSFDLYLPVSSAMTGDAYFADCRSVFTDMNTISIPTSSVSADVSVLFAGRSAYLSFTSTRITKIQLTNATYTNTITLGLSTGQGVTITTNSTTDSTPDNCMYKIYDENNYITSNQLVYNGSKVPLLNNATTSYVKPIFFEYSAIANNVSLKYIVYTSTATELYATPFSGRATIEYNNSNDYTIFMPEHFANGVYNVYSVGNKLYLQDNDIAQIYFPEDYVIELDGNITDIVAISTTVIAVFLRNKVYLLTNNNGVQTITESKLRLGCEEGSTVLLNYDGSVLYIPTLKGLTALGYQELVQSTDQVYSYLSEAIMDKYDEFNNAPIKLVQYKDWIFMYKENYPDILLYDLRSSSWWKWTLFTPIKQLFYDGNYFCIIYNAVYFFNLKYNDYHDYGDAEIDWYVESQKLHLNAPNNYKHISSIQIIADDAEDLQYTMDLYNYRNINSTDYNDTVYYEVVNLKQCIKKVKFLKTCAFKFRLSSDVKNVNRTQFKTSNIAIKYRVTERIR